VVVAACRWAVGSLRTRIRSSSLPLVVVPLVAIVAACGSGGSDAPPDPSAAALTRLRAFETSRRAATDFRSEGAADGMLGPDPVAVVSVDDGRAAVGVLRGADAVVALDAEGRERARAAAPRSPTSIAVGAGDEIFVGAELATEIVRYDARAGTLRRTGSLPLGDVRAVRGIAYGPEGVVYAVEERDHRLVTWALDRGGTPLDAGAPRIGLGPVSVLRTPRWVVVDCILSHEVVALPVDGAGLPRRADAVRVRHDGPVWSVDAHEVGDDLWLALGGVEDHQLDRRQGSFGYIDSFVWIYRVAGTPPVATRLAVVNASALDVVTPKLVRLALDGASVALRIVGYGTATSATLRWSGQRPNRKGVWPRPDVDVRATVPGVVAEASLAGGRRIAADPLLDAWIVDDGRDARIVPVDGVPGGPARDAASRVGEALFFTTLMAPWNRTKGSLSRFTCETCHFEGYVDGRIHDTGRGDVQVTTRSLHGLFNDAPYFSRALDPDLSAMVHNEFRVAGRRSRHDPWFDLDPSRIAWLGALGASTTPLSAEALRRSLMVFLMDFSERPNPSVIGRRTWSADERRGAELFRDDCETCHEARLVAARPDSRVSFADWEPLVMSPAGPIVWARDSYEKTGVVPYVHPSGTRVPSLRRLYKKRPYFTNGSAADLDDVVGRARAEPDGFRHAGADDRAPLLDGPARTALRAFLDLL